MKGHGFLAGSGGVGVRLRDAPRVGESETLSKTDKISVSRGLRGVVIMLAGGGRVTGTGDGLAGATPL